MRERVYPLAQMAVEVGSGAITVKRTICFTIEMVKR